LVPIEPGSHPPLPQIQASAAHERVLTRGFVGDGAKLHWLVPEPVLEDQHDVTFDLLKDYLDWALYRQLRLAHSLSYGPWAEREVFGGVGFMSLNADLDRDDVDEALTVLDDLKAQLLKDGLNAETFNRLKQAAMARQAWAVQGNSALADYYWSALGDYEDGRFANPAKELQAVSLAEANKAMRELLLQPGYVRIEKPLLSDDQVLWVIAGGMGLIVLILLGWQLHRRSTRTM
jgi:predicted Zn-dependent peptidase